MPSPNLDFAYWWHAPRNVLLHPQRNWASCAGQMPSFAVDSYVSWSTCTDSYTLYSDKQSCTHVPGGQVPVHTVKGCKMSQERCAVLIFVVV